MTKEEILQTFSDINYAYNNCSKYDTLKRMLDELTEDMPSKQKMGRWIREKKHHKDDFQEFDYLDVRCSECGARKRIGWTNVRHCPMCGVKMEPYTKGVSR